MRRRPPPSLTKPPCGRCSLSGCQNASQGGCVPGVKLLLDAGADVNVQCMQGGGAYNSGQWGRRAKDGSMRALKKAKDRAPLHFAIEAFMEFRAEGWADVMLKLLLQSNAGRRRPLPRGGSISAESSSPCHLIPRLARTTDPNVRD
eukprot:4449703-Prymnesium_polylepis.1